MRTASLFLVAALLGLSSLPSFGDALVICAKDKSGGDSSDDSLENVPCMEFPHVEGIFAAPLPYDPRAGVKGLVEDFSPTETDFCDGGDLDPNLIARAKGKIVVVRRGDCMFEQKAKRAQDMGALALVVYNTDPESNDLLIMGGDDSEHSGITIPVVFVSGAAGEALVEYVAVSSESGLAVYGLLFAADDADLFFGWFNLAGPLMLGAICIGVGLLGVMLLVSIHKLCCAPRRHRVSAPSDDEDEDVPKTVRAGNIIVGVPVIVKASAPEHSSSLGTPLLKSTQDITLV